MYSLSPTELVRLCHYWLPIDAEHPISHNWTEMEMMRTMRDGDDENRNKNQEANTGGRLELNYNLLSSSGNILPVCSEPRPQIRITTRQKIATSEKIGSHLWEEICRQASEKQVFR